MNNTRAFSQTKFMKAVKWAGFSLCVLALLATAFFAYVPIFDIINLPQNLILHLDDLDAVNEHKLFGKFVNVKLKDTLSPVGTTKDSKDVEVEFKLFDLIPIKTQKVKLMDEEVLAGGMAVGLALKNDGVLIVGSSAVEGKGGEKFDIIKETDLKVGDVITHIEDKKVTDTSMVGKIVNDSENKGKELKITAMRKNKELTVRVKPAYDIKSDSFKLGVWVRDDASGIGTLTFIDKNNRFGALGHPICDSDTGSPVNVCSGELYNCNVLGVNKGINGNVGELRGMFLQGKNIQGHVDKNTEFGVFGEVNDDSDIINKASNVQVGGRLSVSPGKAQIRSSIDGNIKLYDIEIIKTNYQNYQNDKSMIIKVTDKELLSKTGGIVQGMSGSPIIQNGKIVGAVTHVFINDPTRGFGVYLDWMLKEIISGQPA